MTVCAFCGASRKKPQKKEQKKKNPLPENKSQHGSSPLGFSAQADAEITKDNICVCVCVYVPLCNYYFHLISLKLRRKKWENVWEMKIDSIEHHPFYR